MRDHIKTIAIFQGFIAAAVLGVCAPCQADDLPKTISPLMVEPDRNGVNLVTGKITPDALVLSVPADPHLKFDRVQNAAPYVKSDVTKNFDTADEMSAVSTVHTADGVSEGFKCQFDTDAGKICDASLNGTGSMLSYSASKFRRGGSGESYDFSQMYEYSIPKPGDVDQKIHKVFYASSVSYPDGEVISYTYDTLQISTLIPVVLHRPIKLSSNRGYYITIHYGCNDSNQICWYTPSDVAIYNASDPSMPLAKYTYNSDGTTTDLLGRVYSGYDPGELGSPVEVASYSRTLPTEATPALTVSAATGLPAGSPVVGTVNRDGVQWHYAYTNPAYYAGIDGYLYDSLSVTGPNGYHKTYAMAHTSSLSLVGSRNLIASVTDELNRQTIYQYEVAARVNGSDVRLIKITYPEKNSVSISYDDAGNIVTKTTTPKPGSGQANLVDQAFVDLSAYYVPGGYLNCLSTVLCYRPIWYKDALNRETDLTYNSYGQPTQVLEPADSAGVRRETDITYTISPSGISRKTLVRICGSTTTCAGNAESHIEYTYWGETDLPLTVTEKDEATGATRTTTYAYDKAGRVTMVDGPLPGTGDAKYVQYDALGRKILEIGELGPNNLRIANLFRYRDSDDKMISTVTGTVNCSTACDATTVSLTVQQETDALYDSRRNPIRQTTFHGATTFGVTDSSFLDRGLAECSTVRMNLNDLPAATDHGACSLGVQGASGPDRITRDSYDAAGQLTLVQKAYGVTVANGFPATLQANYAAYTYTNNGRQLTVTDANGNEAQYGYDGFDRLIKWTFPSQTTPGTLNAADYEQYAYDAVGNRTCLRKRDGAKLIYTFDGLNRVRSKSVAATSGGACP